MNHLKKSQKNIQCSQSCLKVNLLAADLAEWLSPTMTLPLEYFRTTISRITLVVSGQSDGFWKPQIRPKKPFIVDVAFFNTLSLTLCKIYKNKGSLTCICLYTNRIFDSVLMRDNTDQRKLTLWHILQSVVMTKIYSTEATFLPNFTYVGDAFVSYQPLLGQFVEIKMPSDKAHIKLGLCTTNIRSYHADIEMGNNPVKY